jgi:cell surface protein
METSNSNSESEKVKPFEYECDEKGTLTISRLVEEPIALSKAETDMWSFSITVPGRGIIEGIHLKDLKSRVRTLVVKGEVEKIGDDVFSNCPSLENVELSSSLQSIGDNAFQKCNTLRRIRIPDGVTRLGTSVFYECDDLEEIESESLRYPAEDGVLFKVADDGKKILVRYPSNRKGKHYTIPKDVVEIEEHAFAKCCNLKSITIPETVRKIGRDAFDTCWDLESIIVSWLCPPEEINSHIFGSYINPSEIQLIVPKGRKSAYCKEDQVWENCEVIEEGDEGI